MGRPGHARRRRGPWAFVALCLGGGLLLGIAVTVIGVVLRDASPNGASVAAESVRNAGIAIFGGVAVGGFITLAQRAVNLDLARRNAEAERQRSLDLTIATQQDLRTIDLGGARLERRYLAGKDLSDAELGDADLRLANLRGAKLVGAQLVGTTLVGADLTDVDLTGADLTGADLSGAVLSGATLRNVVSDGTTIWPADPPLTR